ncbi:hypothetical protein E0500_027680 [Streptomyces sp. KM273126]|uniref:hypothetical protein n=1 Tax=Streptomyces sp. KM273126 TaxID=2545247 RepID=UPI001038A968|nr:hypothetical protein [Streptomyces sp. KM273126]MBA2811079.1 hypothetical protein [Streptomyces sp. KM273126]
MRVPNVIGDWQECDGGHAGLRVRVHGVERAEPPRGRDDAAEGLVYFRFRVTVENRAGTPFGIHVEDGQFDVRTGPDGESAFLDWRNSQFIEGFDLYPLRRATAVVYAAAADSSLARVDIQIQLRTDEEWADRYLWAGGIGAHGDVLGRDSALDGTGEGLACQVSSFLQREAEQGPA